MKRIIFFLSVLISFSACAQFRAGNVVVTGELKAKKITVNCMNQDSTPGVNLFYNFRRSGKKVWSLGADASAMIGSNTGSNFLLTAYDDNGNAIDNPISIGRSASLGNYNITFSRPLVIANANLPTANNASYALVMNNTGTLFKVQGNTPGQVLLWNGSGWGAGTVSVGGGGGGSLPSQSGNDYRLLMTNGTSASWTDAVLNGPTVLSLNKDIVNINSVTTNARGSDFNLIGSGTKPIVSFQGDATTTYLRAATGNGDFTIPDEIGTAASREWVSNFYIPIDDNATINGTKTFSGPVRFISGGTYDGAYGYDGYRITDASGNHYVQVLAPSLTADRTQNKIDADGNGVLSDLTGDPVIINSQSPQDGDLLQYNSSQGKWINKKAPKVYTARLNQGGVADPVADVYENSLGVDITWTRSGAGFYVGTRSSGNWNKPWLVIGDRNVDASSYIAKNYALAGAGQNVVIVYTYDNAGNLADDLIDVDIEIRDYQ